MITATWCSAQFTRSYRPMVPLNWSGSVACSFFQEAADMFASRQSFSSVCVSFRIFLSIICAKLLNFCVFCFLRQHNRRSWQTSFIAFTGAVHTTTRLSVVVCVLTLQAGVCHTDECEMPHAAESKDLFTWLFFFSDIIRFPLAML